VREEAVLFGKTGSLVGIITDPPVVNSNPQLPAIICLNAGIIHRVGPNRLYVKLARALAALGFVVLRFDFSGIGDSPFRDDTLPFRQSAVSETQEAMNYLEAARGSKRFVLTGICSGAMISFHTACCDPRVGGAVLINPRGHLHDDTEEVPASLRNRTLARHYWRITFSSSFRAKNWRKALTGKVDYRSILLTLMGSGLSNLLGRRENGLSEVAHAADALRLLAERSVRLLHIYSEGDESLDYLSVILGREVQKRHESELLPMEIIVGANHTFTLLWSQDHLLHLVQNWVQKNLATDCA
jgi:dienelactone hydrolase